MLDVTLAYLSCPGGNTSHTRSPCSVGSIAGERGSALVQVGCPSSPGEPNLGSANAGIAIATIIAAKTRATVNTKSMRLIDATSFTVGRDSSENRRVAQWGNYGGYKSWRNFRE